jgi:hypothetical protein
MNTDPLTTDDMPIEQVLEAAKDQAKGLVIVLSYDADGELYFASSTSAGASVVDVMAKANRFVEQNLK